MFIAKTSTEFNLQCLKKCLHCNTDISSLDVNHSSFCCRGCEMVYTLLQERGLEKFYSLRNRIKSDFKPVSISTLRELHEFSYLDDPSFLKEFNFADERQMYFYLEGVHCAACVWLTEKLPEFINGVESLSLNLSTGVALVRLNMGGRFSEVAKELLRLGYRAHPVKQDESEELQKKENRKNLIQLGVAGMFSGNIMLLAVALYAGADGPLRELFRWTSLVLFLPVLFYSANPFYRGAFGALLKKKVSIDVPIVFGLLVATGASILNLINGSDHIYFDTIATLVFLLLSTRYLLKRMNQHALSASHALNVFAPAKARRLLTDSVNSNGFEEIKTDALRKGDVFQVLPGEGIAADGLIIRGESSVNCSLLTGETLAQKVGPGDRVNAGTFNQDAPIEVRVLYTGAATRFGKILTAMEKDLNSKAPIVSVLDRVGQVFIVTVVLLSFIGFFIGLQISWDEAINRALAVAIIVCPCTFALATPLAFSLALGRAAKNGILLKSAEMIERLWQVKTVFFDKTGTLTQGELQVLEWKEYLPGSLLPLLALESKSIHPIAKAIMRHFHEFQNKNAFSEVLHFNEKAGVGVSGIIDGSLYEIRSLSENKNVKEASFANGFIASVALLKNGVLAGELTLADQVRVDSKEAINKLKNLGVEVFILSGDQSSAVQAVATQLGIDLKNSIAQASPEKKSQILKSFPKSLMVGDGANDAIALASAYASVAVQGGMEMSIRAAGAYSSQPGVLSIPYLMSSALETMKVIRRNLFFAILYNVIGITAALSGYLNPLFAAVLMPVSALTVFLSTIIGTRRIREERVV